ncbi:MAG: redoxin domain-containing protein [Candidatus Eisenbacteria bacterium]|nr:redoxin domain-containing protein [Candidatus Eisenbacteria bacterium]
MAQLCRLGDEFEKLGVRVIVVAYSSPGAARRWIESVCPRFPILLDPRREFYAALGFERSYRRALSGRNIRKHARDFLQGKRSAGREGDPAQMGGDLLLSGTGRVLLLHRSSDPVDRPQPEEILERIRQEDSP